MGTYYTLNSTRSDLIEELCSERKHYKMAARYFCGNCLWTLWEPIGEAMERGAEPFIHMDLLTCYRHDGMTDWGYKPLGEDCHPYYYSCPVSWFDKAPVACQEWREGCIRYWERRKTKARIRKAARS